MDLLGRKAKAELEAVRAELTKEQAYCQYLDWWLQREIETANARDAELSARLSGSETLVRELISENAILEVKLANALFQAAKPVPKPSFRPSEALYMSEEEQELRWREEQGLMRKGELEAALEQLDFENTEIELDPDYTPRSPTY